MILKSPAKLNLFLEVLDKRRDNYHNIRTVFERIDLSDRIILKPRRDKEIKVTCNSPHVPADNSNLAYRSAKLLQEIYNVARGVDIRIIKRIPVGSGLGGGSGNAATVLMGLNKLWNLDIPRNRLLNLSRKIGSDVPFFIYNCPFAQGLSRGDRVKPLRMCSNLKLWHVLVVPKIRVSTPLIYKRWDMKYPGLVKKAGLTKPKYSVNILISALKKKDIPLIDKALFNNLERVTAELYPQVTHIKDKLKCLGLKSILMSGSGPAIFCITSSGKEAVSLGRQLEKGHSSWQVFVTRTI